MKKILILVVAIIAIADVACAQTKTMTVVRTNGTSHDYEISKIKNLKYSDSEWTSLGYCLYGEDYIGSAVWPSEGERGDLCCEYYVEVQEKNTQPGLYRLVNPYSPDIYPFVEYDRYDTANDYYIEINATNPARVYIDKQFTGMYFSYFEMFYVYSKAKYDYDTGRAWSQIDEDGSAGTLVDGVITFPNSTLYCQFPSHNSAYYIGNANERFKLDLNDKSDAPGVKDSVKRHSVTKSLSADEDSVVPAEEMAEDKRE